MKKFIALLFVLAALAGIQVFSFATEYGENCPWCGKDNWEYMDPIRDATCTEDGCKGFICKNAGCGYEKIIETIPATKHSFEKSDCTSQRICTYCNTANPNAFTYFSYDLDTQLYTHLAPTITTLTPYREPQTATGYIIYSVNQSGIIRLGSQDSTSITCDINSSLSIQALSAGNVVLTLEIYDGCGYYNTLQSNITVTGPVVPDPISIEVFPKSATLEPSQSMTISASVLPTGANQNVSWYSDSPSVATVTAAGVITGVSPGDATVTVTSNASKLVYTTIPVHVPVVYLNKITFASKEYTLNAGGYTSVSPDLSPANAVNKNLVWSSTNSNVAYVDQNGILYGISPGVAVITATSATDSSISDSFSVTVKISGTGGGTSSTIYKRSYSPGYYSSGTTYEDTAYSGETVHLRGALYSRSGYTQTGWSTDPYGSSLNYNLYAEYINTADLTLYPYWTVNPSAPLKLYITYNSSLGTVYFNGKVFPSNHYWSINPGETLNFSFVPISNYYASYIKLAGRYLGIYNNAFSVSYDDMRASDQTATVSFVSIYSHPKTGDTGNAALWATVGMISLTGLTIVALRKRKRS